MGRCSNFEVLYLISYLLHCSVVAGNHTYRAILIALEGLMSTLVGLICGNKSYVVKCCYMRHRGSWRNVYTAADDKKGTLKLESNPGPSYFELSIEF